MCVCVSVCVSQGLYVEMKFERPSRIQSTTLPMILSPPYKDLIAQVEKRLHSHSKASHTYSHNTRSQYRVWLIARIGKVHWYCVRCVTGAQRLRQDNVFRARHAQQVRATALLHPAHLVRHMSSV